MFFRETREKEEDIRRMFCEPRDKMRMMITLKKKSDPGQFAIPCTVKASIETHTATSIDSGHHKSDDTLYDESVDSRPDDWENDYYNPAIAAYTRQHMHREEYDEDYEEERATEYRAILDEEDKLLHHSSGKRNAPSIDMTSWPSIDTQPHQRCRKQASTDTAYYKSIDTEVNRAQEGDYSIGSWAYEHHHESFAIRFEQKLLGKELVSAIRSTGQSAHQSIDNNNATLIGVAIPTSVDRQPEFGRRAYDLYGNMEFYLEEKDEYGVYRDDQRYARDLDGNTIRLHNTDIRQLLERASRDEPSYICLPEHSNLFTQTKLVPEIYTKDEINDMFYGVNGEHEKNKEAFQMKHDGVYYPLNDSISWLTTCMEEMKQDIARIQHATDVARPPSIDRRRPPSIDNRQPPSIDRHHRTSIDNPMPASINDSPPCPHTMKSQKDFHTREEIDQLIEGIYRALETTEERLDGRCDDINFPTDLSISALTSKIEAIQRELVEIQSYIARRPEASSSIDRRNNISTDINHRTSVDDTTNPGQLVPKMTSDMSDTHYHGEEISADTYATLRRHQFNVESLEERLQRMENTTATVKEKWRRGDEALRDFTGT
ncbi:hypothetical protein F2Q69_00052884 [Brassica cretica]|uniref:Uncharacterized protein n=1 Tax=Brassica cretica TaxID=69181 RepID=A0A8S9NBA2_BRACR|nr:hypothetical protein F2Q69_00052884 [Brassica cretica]